MQVQRSGTQKENKRKGQEELGQSLQILNLQPKEASHLTYELLLLICQEALSPLQYCSLAPSCSVPFYSTAGSISTLFSYTLWVQPPSQCGPFLLIWLISHPLESIPLASMQLSVSLNESLLQSRRLISTSPEVKGWSSLIGN